jgi:hypothetical protein
VRKGYHVRELIGMARRFFEPLYFCKDCSGERRFPSGARFLRALTGRRGELSRERKGEDGGGGNGPSSVKKGPLPSLGLSAES